ncbi:ribosomal silencing factor RsfS [mine drainage metagenome]|uniref:Ribosomal silencing factor RsfS n=1 Tax=mine drainage metagenome TaxID=410659 RepID=A0A1J5RTD1_9ZZZZ
MDIRKLQRTIVDALEDVKAQDIQVFNTEALTSLFDRVIVASGTSNRQTRSLAASVRDRVRAAGGTVKNPEGEGSGEWVLVDCGDAVVHIMQPVIRAYYKLEDIWGGKSVHLKARQDAVAAAAAVAARSASAEPAAKKVAKKAPAAKPRATTSRTGKASATPAARKTPAKRSAWPGTMSTTSAGDDNASASRSRAKPRTTASALSSTPPAARKRTGSGSTAGGKTTAVRRSPAKKSAS